MGENPCFTDWTVKCKTEGCGSLILDIIGPCHLGRVVYLPTCRSFDVACSGYMKTFTYSRSDVRAENILREPTSADRSSSFQDAIQPEPHLGEE